MRLPITIIENTLINKELNVWWLILIISQDCIIKFLRNNIDEVERCLTHVKVNQSSIYTDHKLFTSYNKSVTVRSRVEKRSDCRFMHAGLSFFILNICDFQTEKKMQKSSSQYDSFLFWRQPIPSLDLSELEDLGFTIGEAVSSSKAKDKKPQQRGRDEASRFIYWVFASSLPAYVQNVNCLFIPAGWALRVFLL